MPLEKAPFAKVCVTAVTQPYMPCHRVGGCVITRAAMPHAPAACCDVPCSGQGPQHACCQSENENSVPWLEHPEPPPTPPKICNRAWPGCCAPTGTGCWTKTTRASQVARGGHRGAAQRRVPAQLSLAPVSLTSQYR